MKKFLLLLLALATLSCSKTNNQPSYPTQAGEGGWDIELRSTGLSNIALTKNTDTTITIPVTVAYEAVGNMSASDSLSFSLLPADVSVAPSSYFNGSFENTSGVLTDTFVFHINAIDTGTFPIAVVAYGGHAPESDTFYLIVY